MLVLQLMWLCKFCISFLNLKGLAILQLQMRYNIQFTFHESSNEILVELIKSGVYLDNTMDTLNGICMPLVGPENLPLTLGSFGSSIETAETLGLLNFRCYHCYGFQLHGL
ncbi:hypothetical protein MKW92_050600 [Papaver armeniacum]|nr:hypothetical protein MKW92_050600 [Papaver armeniacum]